MEQRNVGVDGWMLLGLYGNPYLIIIAIGVL
jgi:hypothetical protein